MWQIVDENFIILVHNNPNKGTVVKVLFNRETGEIRLVEKKAFQKRGKQFYENLFNNRINPYIHATQEESVELLTTPKSKFSSWQYKEGE